MSFPEELLEVLAKSEGLWTDHAADSRDRLSLDWEDIVSVARTASSCKKERDEKREGAYKYAVVGRDTRGRQLYMAGKLVRYDGEQLWRVITIHEAH